MTAPRHRTARRALQALLASLALAASGAGAADVAWGTDIPDGQDHPLMRRFEGAWLVGYRQQPWDQTLWPTSVAVAASDQLKAPLTLEGRITRLVYLAPKDKSPLEVFRNHEQAFLSAGFKREFACEQDCDKFYWAWHRHAKPADGLHWQERGSIPAGSGGGRYSMGSALQPSHGRFWVGSSSASGQAVRVLLFTGDAATDKTGIATVYLQIVEPRAMATGQVVVVDAGALQDGLGAVGKAVLGGLVFDTGRAELKPESRPQLEAMAAVLRAQPVWKVFIVGHTDNAGTLAANEQLSLRRAQAVVAALTAAPFGIDAQRLLARGVANAAPVASNADDAGRARNRRVEMVLQ